MLEGDWTLLQGSCRPVKTHAALAVLNPTVGNGLSAAFSFFIFNNNLSKHTISTLKAHKSVLNSTRTLTEPTQPSFIKQTLL